MEERPTRWSSSVGEAHPEVREGSGGPLGGLGSVGRPTRISRKSLEARS